MLMLLFLSRCWVPSFFIYASGQCHHTGFPKSSMNGTWEPSRNAHFQASLDLPKRSRNSRVGPSNNPPSDSDENHCIITQRAFDSSQFPGPHLTSAQQLWGGALESSFLKTPCWAWGTNRCEHKISRKYMFTIRVFNGTVYLMCELYNCNLGVNNGLSSDQLSDLGQVTLQTPSPHL